MLILRSARKHRVAEEDIRHAIHHALGVAPESDGLTMWVGPGRDGTLLEVGIVEARDFDGYVVVHAMFMRSKYQRLLPR